MGHRHHGGGGPRFYGQMYPQAQPTIVIVGEDRYGDRIRCRCPRGRVCSATCPCRVHHRALGNYILEGEAAPESIGIVGALAIGVGLWWFLGRGKAV